MQNPFSCPGSPVASVPVSSPVVEVSPLSFLVQEARETDGLLLKLSCSECLRCGSALRLNVTTMGKSPYALPFSQMSTPLQGLPAVDRSPVPSALKKQPEDFSCYL